MCVVLFPVSKRELLFWCWWNIFLWTPLWLLRWYFAFVLPILGYHSSMWGSAAECHLQLLEHQVYSVSRLCPNQSSFLCRQRLGFVCCRDGLDVKICLSTPQMQICMRIPAIEALQMWIHWECQLVDIRGCRCEYLWHSKVTPVIVKWELLLLQNTDYYIIKNINYWLQSAEDYKFVINLDKFQHH